VARWKNFASGAAARWDAAGGAVSDSAGSGEAFIENERGEPEMAPCITPRALETVEIPYIVRQYERGARNALEAGFDGVEIHGANGYLIDQFLCSRTNHRMDEYGGPPAHRARLLKEVVEAVVSVWQTDRVGVRISPLGTFNDMDDEDPETTFGYVVRMLSTLDLAYLHVVNPAIAALENKTEPDEQSRRMLNLIRTEYRGTLILAGGFDHDSAEEWITSRRADAIAFGRKFLANPDLPERFREHAPLNRDDPSTYYGGGEKGYTDYSTLAQQRGEQPKPCQDTRWR
jgi:N-ethylmaleimide reductase